MEVRKRNWGFLTMMSALMVWTLAGCDGLDSLLEADLPGNVVEGDLNSPVLATTLVRGAESDFNCAFAAWLMVTTLYTSTMDQAATLTTHGDLQGRRSAITDFGDATCTLDGSPRPFGFWGPLNIARSQARRAVTLIEAFPEGTVAERDFLIGKALAYEGYAYQLLGESFCDLYFDRGPLTTREETWEIAVGRFTSALERIGGSTSTEARSIRNMALVGRARAHLNLGNRSNVLADAGAVDKDFERRTDHSGLNTFRYNHIYNRSHVGLAYSVSNMESTYREVEVDGIWTLTVDGVPDPRVRSRFAGPGNNQFTPMYLQLKYLSRSDPIPFATWKEAQLMIAEVEGGQVAVGIINMLRDYHDLPHFANTDLDEIMAQVHEERRRELWLQGRRMGDMLRLGIPFPTGVTPAGQVIVEESPWCFPTMEAERLGNPNVL